MASGRTPRSKSLVVPSQPGGSESTPGVQESATSAASGITLMASPSRSIWQGRIFIGGVPTKVATKRSARVLVDRSRRAALEHPSAFENDHAIAHQQGFGLVVRDVDQRRAEAAMKVDHLLAQAGAKRRVETRERLVEQDHAGLARQRPADRHALPLAAGKLARPPRNKWSRPSMPATVLTLVCSLIRETPRALSPKARLSNTDRCGYRAGCWKTMATSRRCGATRVMSRPSNQTLPPLGESSPAISRNSVLLPEPDGPRTTSNSPGWMVRSIGWRAAISPGNTFASCRSSICAKVVPHGPRCGRCLISEQ